MQIKTFDKILKILLSISPIPVTMFVGSFIKDSVTAQAYGFLAVLIILVGIPSIITSGKIMSSFTANKPRARLYSLLGYAIPALIFFGFAIEQALLNT
jgi:hypothetical protein